ncbi:protein regulator of cytokinesis 1 isoform X2 [Cephus cinctus]|uniref:Protein regulator of cytokinesis 1 isoform X2 n=2 Tax=Cephus cinctus TaxID=211228 RepID=A0AAJ7CC57_CEPCN|nr:protein regulator of cytokinesis 1 isoform X2 [Cephus cinctus]
MKMEKSFDDTFDVLKEACTKLQKLWDRIGYSEEAKGYFCTTVHNHVTELLKEMVKETTEKEQLFIQQIQDLNLKKKELSKELQLEDNSIDEEYVNLLPMRNSLESEVDHLRSIKDRRLKYFHELLETELEICDSLGTSPRELHSVVPTEEELQEFKEYLEQQKTEKNRLESIFRDTRRAIIKMMDELRITPSLDFERVVCNDDENFVYTSTNMANLKELRDSLKEQVEEAKFQAQQKREELITLWKYLEEPQHLCEKFLQTYPDYNVTTLTALNDEIKRCKEKRTENVAKYIKKIRLQIQDLWDLCKYSEEQRKEFVFFHSEVYTEDLLLHHELEAEQLRKFYEANKSTFELLVERQNLWEKIKELEQRASDPGRYNNRGGQLLAEERERKQIQKKLPVIEEKLNNFADRYEEKNGTVFTVNGVPLADFLKQTWEDYEKSKASMKEARKHAKDQNNKTQLGSAKRTPGRTGVAGLTPASSKRKLPCEPTPSSISSVHKKRTASSDKNRPKVISAKIKKGSRASRRIFNNSGNRNSQTMPSEKRRKRKSSSMNVTDTSYGRFQEHLEQREELRSSFLPEHLLNNVTNKQKSKTPVKTPVKPLRASRLTVPSPRHNFNTPNKSQSRVGNQSVSRTPRSPRIVTTPRLATAPSNLPIIF